MSMKEAQDVVVRSHEQLHRAGIRLVVGQDGGIDVTMWRYEREPGHLPVKP
jgi:hypothetical protein